MHRHLQIPVHYIESMASEDEKEVLDINSVASSFREHVKNSCLQKFSPLYFTGKILLILRSKSAYFLYQTDLGKHSFWPHKIVQILLSVVIVKSRLYLIYEYDNLEDKEGERGVTMCKMGGLQMCTTPKIIIYTLIEEKVPANRHSFWCLLPYKAGTRITGLYRQNIELFVGCRGVFCKLYNVHKIL